MKLLVMRHGETDFNVQYKISGSNLAQLTELGKQQARDKKSILQQYPIDQIYCSPYQRAIDTANLANPYDLPIVIDERLHELDFGIFEGMSRDTQAFKDVKYHLGVRYPEGETFLELVYRIYSFIEELKKTEDQCVLVVCHGAVQRAFHTYFNDMTNDDLYTYTTHNCQINEYEL